MQLIICKPIVALLASVYVVTTTMLLAKMPTISVIETSLRGRDQQNLATSGVFQHQLAKSDSEHSENGSAVVMGAKDYTDDCLPNLRWAFGTDKDDDTSFIVQPPTHACCVSRPGSVFLLILVTSSLRQFKVRQAIRESWASVFVAPGGRRVVTRFVLGIRTDQSGEAANWRHQSRVEAEGALYGDIVQADFDDVYRNLTLKTRAGLRWAGRHCPAASYVMKTDSDVYVNVDAIIRYLTNSSLANSSLIARNVAVGAIAVNATPQRHWAGKWYTSETTYPHPTYPPFANGPGYILSQSVVQLLLQSFKTTPFFVWEDVYIGMCLQKLGIVLKTDERFETFGIRIRNGCDVTRRFIVHSVSYYNLRKLWNWHRKALRSKKCVNSTI